MGPNKTVLDLGCGKGTPSLLWASVFGVQVEGFDINKNYVEYANSRAEMLNLSHRVEYVCEDIRELRFGREYDVVASLGLGVAHVYGNIDNALRIFKAMLHREGVLIFAEPAWLSKPIPAKVLKTLGEAEDSFLTKPEMQRLMGESGFHVLGSLASSKEDWEIYVRPIYVAMHEIIDDKDELSEEAQRVIDGFIAEYDAVGHYWDMILWVARAHHLGAEDIF
ncbi:MAG: class I SAM-dependent methyltransferase [Candidatus Bathyarchaeota archaeon]|nr:MAG: class I SAM-dependent methyltransferase [Candidatus Bathyarchaeota archaeon]